MKKIQKLFLATYALSLLVLGITVFTPATTFAAGNNGCETDTAIIKCDNSQDDGDDTTLEGSGLWSLLLTGINILTAGVGVVALAGLVYGAVLYTSAGGSPDQIKKARTIFTNVVIGIIAFAGMWGLLNFIIPGGVL